jgi:hypothetical protein
MRIAGILSSDSTELLNAAFETLELLPAEQRRLAKLPKRKRHLISINQIEAVHAKVFPIEDQAPEFTDEKLEMLDRKVSDLEQREVLEPMEAKILHMLLQGERLRTICKELHLKQADLLALAGGLAGKIQTGSRHLN